MFCVKQLPPFAAYTANTPVVPKLYWDVYSQEQRWKEICCWLKKLTDYAEETNTNLGITADAVAQLEKEFERFKETGFLDYYLAQIEKWINDNFATIMEKLVGIGIYFGLTDDGYFCAYVPDSWDDITFDTGAVYGTGDYGRLILKY